jgi:hypothetical protein
MLGQHGDGRIGPKTEARDFKQRKGNCAVYVHQIHQAAWIVLSNKTVWAFLMEDKPQLYGYRGIWQCKSADTNVIKLIEKIYKVQKPRFGN